MDKKIIMPDERHLILRQKPKKVLIGMPFGLGLKLRPHKCWIDLTLEAVNSPRYVILEKYTDSAYIAQNRDDLAKEALDKNCDYLLMIDDDMVYPPTILDTLVQTDKDVVGIEYCSYRPDPKDKRRLINEPVIFDYDRKKVGWHRWRNCKEKKPFRVDGVGTGLILIKASVFREIKGPWFHSFKYETAEESGVMGEDLSFCLRCMGKGIEIWVNPIPEIGHLKDYIYTKKDYTFEGKKKRR